MEITNEIKAKILYPYTLGKTKWKLLQETYYDESDPKENMGHGIKKKGFVFEIEPFYKTKNAFRYGNNYNNWFEKLINVALPILKPLSAITDEDAVTVIDMCGKSKEAKDFKEFYDMLKKQNKFIEYFFTMKPLYFVEVVNAYQFLQSKGYDLPHYLLGGKTLQQAGLAVY